MENIENNIADCKFKDEVCINVQRIYDTCKDKDCFADLRVYLSPQDQKVIDNAINVRTHKSELVWTSVDLDPVPFNKGFYTVNIIFFFMLEFEVYTGVGRPIIVEGLASCSKTMILFGSEGNSVTYSSCSYGEGHSKHEKPTRNLPVAQIDVVDPIVLNAKTVPVKGKVCCCETDLQSVPECVLCYFEDGLTSNSELNLVVTIGLFSIVRIVRDVQILVPSAKFCLPDRECKPIGEEEPCNYFERLSFPTNEFFPPDYKNSGCRQ